ncbi:MAG: nucleotidyltransferase domain-containing protein [bacterium]
MIDILNEIKQAIFSVEPDADIYLFGSRARGDYQDDSDWDLLILLDGMINTRRKEKIIEALIDTEITHGITVFPMAMNKEYWKYDKVFHVTPFYKNVYSEYLAI